MIQAATTVQYYSGFDNLPINTMGVTLIDKPNLSEHYAAIQNAMHTSLGGNSNLSFGRFYKDGSSDCIYWFRSGEATGDLFDSWQEVYWSGIVGEVPSLVDNAQWGADNFVQMVSEGQTVAVLQFYFDQSTFSATLLASAYNVEGLTLQEGMNAIGFANIPEPSLSVLSLLGTGALLFRRRR